MATDRPQEPHLLTGFNALGQDAEAQAFRHRRDSGRDGGVALAAVHVTDKRAIDLEKIDGKVPEVIQGRVTRAKIVDGQIHADLLEFAHQVERLFGVFHQNALRQLEFKAMRRQPAVCERTLHAGDEGTGAELPHGEIHRNAQVAVPGIVPLPALPARLLQYPFAGGNNQTRVLQQGNELFRQHQALRGMLPAQQGLRPV